MGGAADGCADETSVCGTAADAASSTARTNNHRKAGWQCTETETGTAGPGPAASRDGSCGIGALLIQSCSTEARWSENVALAVGAMVAPPRLLAGSVSGLADGGPGLLAAEVAPGKLTSKLVQTAGGTAVPGTAANHARNVVVAAAKCPAAASPETVSDQSAPESLPPPPTPPPLLRMLPIACDNCASSCCVNSSWKRGQSTTGGTGTLAGDGPGNPRGILCCARARPTAHQIRTSTAYGTRCEAVASRAQEMIAGLNDKTRGNCNAWSRNAATTAASPQNPSDTRHSSWRSWRATVDSCRAKAAKMMSLYVRDRDGSCR